MVLTCHLLTGAAIASRISNPILTLPLAFLSHYLLDLLPHKDYSITNIKEKRWNKAFFDFSKVFLDIFLGILLISLFSENAPIIFIGALSAIVPDGITFMAILFPQNKLWIQHQKLHKVLNSIGDAEANKKIPYLWGFFSQITIIFLTILSLI